MAGVRALIRTGLPCTSTGTGSLCPLMNPDRLESLSYENSSRSSLSLPHAEKLLQADGVRLIGANLEPVDIRAAEPLPELLFAIVCGPGEQRPHLWMPRVQLDDFIGLGVTQRKEADVW